DNLRRVRLDSPWLLLKLLLVLVMLALAAHRDFALVPRATRDIGAGVAPGLALGAVRRLDRVLVVLSGAGRLRRGGGAARARAGSPRGGEPPPGADGTRRPALW